ncbi:uncharacterized membrane protein YjjP (DUF1212 family) [Bradyrhizobium sp. AZCC 2230]
MTSAMYLTPRHLKRLFLVYGLFMLAGGLLALLGVTAWERPQFFISFLGGAACGVASRYLQRSGALGVIFNRTKELLYSLHMLRA